LHTKFWSENLKERGHAEDLDVDGKVILGWKFGRKVWNGCIYSRYGHVEGLM